MTNGSEYVSLEWSPDVQISEQFGVRGTWLQLVCCAASCCHVPNLGGQGLVGERRSELEMTLPLKTKVRQG